jgi:tetratricopeptide (TPR) repeat protein
MYGKKDVVHGYGHCDHCGKYGRNISYSGRKFGHIYFIPLIPAGGPARVVKECKSCSHGMHLPQKDVPTVVEGIRSSTKNALAALIAGNKTFDDEGAETDAVSCLAGSIELLLCLQADDYIDLMMGAIKEKNLSYASHMVNGEKHEFEGRLHEAAAEYKQACDLAKTEPMPLVSLGSVYMKQGDIDRAVDYYERALQISEHKFPVLQILLGVYEAKKDWDKLTKTYEACFTIIPELKDEKKIIKAYKKACKKAGKEPTLA